MNTLKNENTGNKPLVKKSTYNQLIRLLHNKDFCELISGATEKLKKLGGKQTIDFRIKCIRSIEKFLQNKKIPLSWIEPIYSFIINNKFDFPYENEISLKVGSDEMTINKEEILLIRDLKTGLLLNDKKLSIVITARTSIDRIIQFIRLYSKDIEHWQKVLELPEYKSPSWHKTNLALEIIRMKDEQNMTFTKIAGILSSDEKLSTDEQDYYGDDSTIKSIYYRYKRYFSSIT